MVDELLGVALLDDDTAVHEEDAVRSVAGKLHLVRDDDHRRLVLGQLGLDPATGALAEGVQAQTHQALKNLQAVLQEAGLTLDNVVKTTVFVQDLGDFGTVNEIYGTYFHGGFPARSCVQIAALPKGALVEIECIAVR